MKNDELLHKWLNKTISQEELAVFKQREEYNDLLAVVNSTDDIVLETIDTEASLSHILNQAKVQGEINKSKSGIIRMLSLGVAASLLMFAAFTFWPSNKLVEYTASNNEQLKESLPDHSEFVLNADSKLSYNKENWVTSRSLNLDGEAYFKVKSGSKFTVVTPLGEVAVLGTIFNVKNRDGYLEIMCFEGRVEVRAEKFKITQVVSANQSIRIDQDGTLSTWDEELSRSDSWTSGITKLRSVSLAQVINELQRQFDVEIDASQIDLSVVVSCNFQQGNLEDALITALSPVNISYHIANDKKVILRK